MNNLHIFAQHHTKRMLAELPTKKWLTPVYNRGLTFTKRWLQTDRLADGRLIMSDLQHPADAEYVGLLNARAHHKYFWTKFSWEQLPERVQSRLSPATVLGVWITDLGTCPTKNWLEFSEYMHPGMKKSLTGLLKRLVGLDTAHFISTRRSLWANDFICHKDVWEDWRICWQSAFWLMYEQYGWNVPFSDSNVDIVRKPAYFMERVTTAYFASRTDLTVEQY